MMDILRAGILGCGDMARKHAQVLAAMQDQVELTAFCDSDASKARVFADQYTSGRAAVYTEHAALLDQADLNLLIICLPPFGHSDEVERAAAHGVHLLVEKPIALTSEHAWGMVRAAEAARIKTQVGFMYRFGRAVARLKHLLDTGDAGPVGLFTARYFCNSLHAPWWRSREKSGGQMLEQLIHLVDLQRYFMGEPVSVYSRQSNFFHRNLPDYSIEDISATIFGYTGGALGTLQATNGAIPNQWIKEWHVVTQNLVAEFSDWNHATLTFTREPGRAPEVIASEENVFALEMQDLLNAIRTGGETRAPLREGARSLDLVVAAGRSAETHTQVMLEN